MSPKEVARLHDEGGSGVDVKSVQTVDLESIQDEPEAALVARGAAYAREYAAIEEKPTILAMNLATVLLALRKQHGDWLGRSYEYRQVANEVYRQANIQDRDQLTRLKGSVRYHVGNLLRRQLTPRELRALELADTSPLERQQDRRATDMAILRAATVSAEVAASTPKTVGKPPTKSTGKTVTDETVPQQGGGSGTGVKATADHLRLATVAAGLVGQLDANVIDTHMTDGQRAKLDEQLAAVERATRRLRQHIKKRRSGA
jgi:hypothetical protein